jgi:hypothetical protein
VKLIVAAAALLLSTSALGSCRDPFEGDWDSKRGDVTCEHQVRRLSRGTYGIDYVLEGREAGERCRVHGTFRKTGNGLSGQMDSSLEVKVTRSQRKDSLGPVLNSFRGYPCGLLHPVNGRHG